MGEAPTSLPPRDTTPLPTAVVLSLSTRFLVGNDFLPHLPSLDIGEGAFDRLFDLYKELLVAWNKAASGGADGVDAGCYVTDRGEIADAARLEELLARVGDMEARASGRLTDLLAVERGRRRESGGSACRVGAAD